VKIKFIFCILIAHVNLFAIQNQSFIELYFSKICLSKFPTFRLNSHELITFKDDQAYDQVINIWQNRLTKGFETFFAALHKESGITAEILYEQFSNEQLIATYHKLKDAERETMSDAIFIEEQDADVEVIAFIKNILFRYTTKRNIKIVLTDAIAQPTASYGSDLYGHLVFCNINLYTKENVQKYYDSLMGVYDIRYDILPNGVVRWMDISHFLVFKLIFIASLVQHQSSLFVFLLDRCFKKDMISSETICLGADLEKGLNILSAIFQSTNPLESALFILKSEFNSDQNTKMIWKSLVKDLAASYSPQTLSKFKDFAQKIKQESKK
jgi:hypothetical protein